MRTSWILGGLLLVLASVGCGEEAPPLGAKASGALSGSAPKSPNAKQFSVAGGKVTFSMDAASEKIRGRAARGLSGTLFVDPKDLTLTTGNVSVDLGAIEIYQKVLNEDGTFAEEARSDTQNLHAKQWLEVDESTPEPIRAKNRRVEFRISSIESASEKDVSKMSGERRTVTLKAKGDFLLHQRQATKNVDLEVTLTFEGDNATAIKLKTVAPFAVRLAEHDVRPRKGFGKFLQGGLDAMGAKVAKDALVDLDIDLVLGAAPEASAVASAASATPAASASAPTPDDSASAAVSASADASASAAPSASAAVSASAVPSASAAAAAPSGSAKLK